MDIVLAVCDDLILDRFFATLFPLNGEGLSKYAMAASSSSSSSTPTINATLPQFSPTIPPLSSAAQMVEEFLGLSPTEYAKLSMIARDDIRRQFVSLWLIVWVFGMALYFISGTLSYIFVFDKDTFKHPKFLKNQIRQEMQVALGSMPFMSLLTAPFFLTEIRGYSKLYDNVDEYGKFYLYFQFPLFIVFTDALIYCIHRALHHPILYRRLHKKHHKWIMPTPFASHAFHPVDGWSQSLPYHIFPFIFPLHKFSYIVLFTFINIWTVLIHDGEYMANSPLINGAACHTMHHLYFNYNYGQFTTFWDRLGGSYRKPNIELFYKETKMGKEEWERQKQDMEKIVKEVEGDDQYRVYMEEDAKKTN